MKPYFYIIQNIITGNYYAGARWAKNADPAELLVTYYTSSKTVSKNIENYVIRKIKVFENRDDAISYESRFLLKVDAVRNSKFDNLNYGNTPMQLNKNWYNNGSKSTLAFKCPDGWVEGRLLDKTNIGRYTKSAIQKEKISKSLQGNVPSNKGKKFPGTGTKAHLGKTWKLVNGKRIWMEKTNA